MVYKVFAGTAILSLSLVSSSFAFTITGNVVPELSSNSSVLDNFAASGLTLVAQPRLDGNTGFLSLNGTDVLSYVANQDITAFPEGYLVDFDFNNPFVPASSTVTNLTNETLNIWIGDLDGDPNSGNANTYDFISSTGQSLSGLRFFNGINNTAIEVILKSLESLTITITGSDFGSRLGDDGRYITIAESVTTPEIVSEPTSIVGLLGIGMLGFGFKGKKTNE